MVRPVPALPRNPVMTEFLAGGAAAAPLSMRAAATLTTAAVGAARQMLTDLERGRRIDAVVLRSAMEAAFGASDAAGAWDSKTAYGVCEAPTVLFLRKFGSAIRAKAGSTAAMLPMLAKIGSCLPTHTRRTEDSQALQQFSTPIPLGLAACTAAGITPSDRVLEPSAGTGLLAILAELAGGSLMLNELAEGRAALLDHLFADVEVTRFDAAQIDDHLDAEGVPSVVLMNPPFSAVANVDRRMADAVFRHIASALARLCDGGRLVAIAGTGLAPENPAWREAFVRLPDCGRGVFSAAIDGAVYAKHGTQTDTRLLVIDKSPAADPKAFPASQGMACDVATLLNWVTQHVPPRLPVAVPVVAEIGRRPAKSRWAGAIAPSPSSASAGAPVGVELAYETVEWSPPEGARLTVALYEEYGLQSIRIPGSCAHPTELVQSAAIASVAPPKPSYRRHLASSMLADSVLAGAQIESVIYAGEAHSEFLAGSWTVDTTLDVATAARDGIKNAVRFRHGWFLGYGAGAGKGRQVAGILLDNWLKGCRRAVWISKSDKLIEDAQRDWSALGMVRLLLTPLYRFRQGSSSRLSEGILFAPYATQRTDERGEKLSRVGQIVEWLGSEFDGVIVFDESHAMQNAAGGKGERGDLKAVASNRPQAASQQGRAGLRLQHALPHARVVYVSATGATTVHNLAYAQRLGLWGGADFPFATRAEFVEAIEEGVVAAMEVLARDLKALGLYAARSLSYEGVAYELVEHQLTPEQVRIYDAYADAFSIIHNNLDAAMRAANIIGETGTLNGQAKSAARSAFESAKQRFFGHLLTSMKTPSLIRSIDRDLDAGHAAVIQIVSTGEALMERRLAETSAFMEDVKRILVFSDAGGTGRSYHAELWARNRRLRVHYLLEPGWKADAAIQGLGRTNRTNQAQPPLFRPIATDVKAEKRFLSTIARRLNTLGTITRGQRQTGGQGLFRPEDNLESRYGRDALRQLNALLVRGKVNGCSLERFEDATGLKLADANGLRDDLPPITTSLNRLLGLTIGLQNVLFTAFEQLLTARSEGAVASGTYDVGLETLRAESFVVSRRRTIYVHPHTGAETRLLIILQRQRNHPLSLDDALARLSNHTVLLINKHSGRAAVQVPAPSIALDDGEIERRVRLIRPMEQRQVSLNMMAERVESDRERFAAAWLAELAEVPEFTESTIHVVTGLLLPIWKRLPNESTRVYRLQTDAGERIIGRKVSAAWVANVVSADAPALTPHATFAAVLEGRCRVRVMGPNRIKPSGFNDKMRDRLRAYGLFGEIISWKLRMFVPTDASGVRILAKVLETYPVARVSEREAA